VLRPVFLENARSWKDENPLNDLAAYPLKGRTIVIDTATDVVGALPYSAVQRTGHARRFALNSEQLKWKVSLGLRSSEVIDPQLSRGSGVEKPNLRLQQEPRPQKALNVLSGLVFVRKLRLLIPPRCHRLPHIAVRTVRVHDTW
jgi:hypothetical protein